MKNYFIGLDASKGYADFTVLDHSKKVILKSFKLFDTAKDHKRLIEIIERDLIDRVDHIYCGI